MSDEPVSESVDETSAAAAADPTAELQKERDDYYDRWMRKAAEFDNYRRRVEKERREQADQAVVNLLQDLLLIVDDFDRALTVDAGENGEGDRKGGEQIHANLDELLRKQGVTEIDALAADVDRHLRHAGLHDA